MGENITLDPEYADLIIEVNKLKDTVAEKIARERYACFSCSARYREYLYEKDWNFGE